jgi:two-component system sensor histidine kinase PilS (NtrC family)
MVELGINTSLLRDADGHVLGHVVHFQDTTKIRELERRLRRNERLAAIGGLAASVAHEVRNPLAAIAGSAELLAGSTLGETDRRLLEVILRESSRLDRTVGDLLDYTRPRSPEFLSVDLVDLVRNVTDSFRADPANQAVVVELHLPEHLELELDPSQFSQVLWNLLRNATEAMRGKGTIAVRARSAAGHALVEVKDTGPGIDEAQQDRVFEPFYSTKPSGSGIGLALVHKIVEEHGGEIDLRSRPGEGTAFRIELPLTRANASTR